MPECTVCAADFEKKVYRCRSCGSNSWRQLSVFRISGRSVSCGFCSGRPGVCLRCERSLEGRGKLCI